MQNRDKLIEHSLWCNQRPQTVVCVLC